MVEFKPGAHALSAPPKLGGSRDTPAGRERPLLFTPILSPTLPQRNALPVQQQTRLPCFLSKPLPSNPWAQGDGFSRGGHTNNPDPVSGILKLMPTVRLVPKPGVLCSHLTGLP